MDDGFVHVVFRNQAQQRVAVVIYGVDSGGGETQLASGVVSEPSGLFRVASSGYSSYSCTATAQKMVTPVMSTSSRVSVVFTIESGEQM